MARLLAAACFFAPFGITIAGADTLGSSGTTAAAHATAVAPTAAGGVADAVPQQQRPTDALTAAGGIADGGLQTQKQEGKQEQQKPTESLTAAGGIADGGLETIKHEAKQDRQAPEEFPAGSPAAAHATSVTPTAAGGIMDADIQSEKPASTAVTSTSAGGVADAASELQAVVINTAGDVGTQAKKQEHPLNEVKKAAIVRRAPREGSSAAKAASTMEKAHIVGRASSGDSDSQKLEASIPKKETSIVRRVTKSTPTSEWDLQMDAAELDELEATAHDEQLFRKNENCVWSWQEWDDCSKTCDAGKRKRQSQVKKAARGRGSCNPGSSQTETCKEEDCPTTTDAPTLLKASAFRNSNLGSPLVAFAVASLVAYAVW